MVSIGMASCKLGVDGAKIVAEMASVMALTSVNLLKNSLDIESATALAAVKEAEIELELVHFTRRRSSGSPVRLHPGSSSYNEPAKRKRPNYYGDSPESP